jgi:hypothetical protein
MSTVAIRRRCSSIQLVCLEKDVVEYRFFGSNEGGGQHCTWCIGGRFSDVKLHHRL